MLTAHRDSVLGRTTWRLNGLDDVLISVPALAQVSLQTLIVLFSLHHLHGVVHFQLVHLCFQVRQLGDTEHMLCETNPKKTEQYSKIYPG